MLRSGSPEYDVLIYALGRLTSAWAQLEYGLDHCLGAIYMQHDGTSIQTDPPRALGNKLVFLRKAFNTVPSLEPHRPEMLRILDAAKRESDFRHDMIHGVAHKSLAADGSIRIVRLLRKPTSLPKKRFIVNVATINNHADRATVLAHGALSTAADLLGIRRDET